MCSQRTARIIFPLLERFAGHAYWSGFHEIKDLQWRSPEELEARSLEKLRQLLAHAYTHVPYYRDLFRGAGIEPSDIKTPRDLSLLPITKKSEIRRNFPTRVIASDFRPNAKLTKVTSGSTGQPFSFYVDPARMDMIRSAYLFFWDWAGVGPWDSGFRLACPAHFYADQRNRGAVHSIARRILLGSDLVFLDGGDLSLSEFELQLHRRIGKQRYFIWGFPSYGARLAAQIMGRGRELPSYPSVFISYGENLSSVDRRAIERAFRCNVVNHYALTEAPFVAQTCPDNPEVIHVNSEQAILRVVRGDGSDVRPGERGRVVITFLANYVMPFINYDTGDYAVSGDHCSCGRGFPVLQKLEGRASQVIRTPSGKLVGHGTLDGFLCLKESTVSHIWEYQVIQSAIDRVHVRIVSNARFTPESAGELKRDLEQLLGPGMTVVVEKVDKIDLEPSGKRLIIKSLVNPSIDSPEISPTRMDQRLGLFDGSGA
jgi:phenylacetate-CoA ligase